MKKERERYSYGGYRYAAESITFTLNGKLLQLPENVRSNLAYLALCGRHKEVIDGVKCFVRKERRTSDISFVTYGFFEENGNQFYYTKDLLARPDDMQDKLRVYKGWKQFLIDRDRVATCYSVEEGMVAPGETKKPTAKVVEVRVDLNRLVRINVIREAVV